jgi:RecG-like helicase
MSAALRDRPGRLTRLRERWFPTESEMDASTARQRAHHTGATPIGEAPRGTTVRVAGSLRSVCMCASGESPRLEAELYDGTGRISLIWMGRRRISGINPGRSMVVTGRITEVGGRAAMFNPKYELRVGPSR